ncbi:RNA polymerase sigma factor [Dethiobacter alkaliphilus]|uniref:RNA polymerase, sigma-24 subunit, ECF subfamily n=1 Tax=Dethiobacter alkaliphilus AHT 1 TaxID=555088 RepID=C0GD97_DETAL|nr:RNA polymerase sigma factor [Dethiobacter alkaliphilus]EEG78618.1 RNA polymerase, sigma-24 subunit, ECF subfamily [Dethiobacter alkaliphilus AHT 1]
MGNDQIDQHFAAGGETELHRAIELYGQPLLRYCHNILCDYAEAQDAVQVTFIKAYNKRNTFKNSTSLRAWLYRIAYTTCIDILRKKKILSIIPLVPSSLQAPANDNLIADDLKDALLKLTPAERALVFSRVIDETSYADLESIYQVPATTLRKRYERAKAKLAKSLKETNSYYVRLEESK